MKLQRFGSLRFSVSALALIVTTSMAHAQEPVGPSEPILTPELFTDPGPLDSSMPIAPVGVDGPGIVVEFPSDERSDTFPRFDKDSTTLDSVPVEFLGNPYFLGFAHNLYRPPVGERIDPLLVQRLVMRSSDAEGADHTWLNLHTQDCNGLLIPLLLNVFNLIPPLCPFSIGLLAF
jgi:hypothetical protein